MKKRFFISTLSVILMTVFMVPGIVNAKVEATNLKEAVNEEIEIFGSEASYADQVEQLKSYDLSGYKNSNQKVNVYIMKCEGDKIRLSIKEANDKLGTPHLKPLNMGNVSGGKGEIDKNRKLDSMLYRYNKEFEDTRKNMFNRDTRYGLN